jgi:hypothetical protein
MVNRFFDIKLILFFIFLILKLTGKINWSWWCVTSPLWISGIIILSIFIGVLFFSIFMLKSGYSEDDIKRRIEYFFGAKNKKK